MSFKNIKQKKKIKKQKERKKRIIKNCSNNIVFENEDEKGKRGKRQLFPPLIRLDNWGVKEGQESTSRWLAFCNRPNLDGFEGK